MQLFCYFTSCSQRFYKNGLCVRYIFRNFKKNISQAEVAEQVGLSVNYFSCLFKEQMHRSYSEYLLSLKLNYAQNLIDSEQVTKVSTLTSAVGFTSVSYFIKAFKSKFGVTPKEMIESVQNGKASPHEE